MSVSSTPFIASPFKTLLVLYLESLTFVYFPANLSSDYDEVCDPWCQQYWVTVSKLTKDNFQNSVSYQPLSFVQQVDFYSCFVFWLFYFYIYIYPKINSLFFSTFWSMQWFCYGCSSPWQNVASLIETLIFWNLYYHSLCSQSESYFKQSHKFF